MQVDDGGSRNLYPKTKQRKPPIRRKCFPPARLCVFMLKQAHQQWRGSAAPPSKRWLETCAFWSLIRGKLVPNPHSADLTDQCSQFGRRKLYLAPDRLGEIGEKTDRLRWWLPECGPTREGPNERDANGRMQNQGKKPDARSPLWIECFAFLSWGKLIPEVPCPQDLFFKPRAGWNVCTK